MINNSENHCTLLHLLYCCRRSRNTSGLFEYIGSCSYVYILFAFNLDAAGEDEQHDQEKHHKNTNGKMIQVSRHFRRASPLIIPRNIF